MSIADDVKAAKERHVPWWLLLSIIVGALPAYWLFDKYGKAHYCVACLKLHSSTKFSSYCEVEAEEACLVLVHYDGAAVTSCAIDSVRSVDYQTGPSFDNWFRRLGGLVPYALGSVGCRQVHGTSSHR
jgi:hypothetical protein